MREQHAWFWQRRRTQQEEVATWGDEEEAPTCRGCGNPSTTLFCAECTYGQMRDERKLDVEAQKAARRAARKGWR